MSLSEYVRREDLKTLYALPMKEASKKLGVSESSLRNICRKHNIERWPYRKFQQLDAHIASLQNVEVSQQSQQQKEMIESLLRARSILEDNPNMTCEMAILQANKQLLANNPQNGSQVQEMTAQMMNMMNQNPSMDDASPTISENSSLHHSMGGGVGNNNNNLDNSSNQIQRSPMHQHHHHGTTFVPSYPTHVTSHLSASAALSAMARRKKHPQYVSNNAASSSILDTLDQQSRSTSMFSVQSNPTIEIQQPNRFTDSDVMNPQHHAYLHHQTILNSHNPHMRSVSSDNIFPSASNGMIGVGNMQGNSSMEMITNMGERRGAVSHRDSLAFGQGFVLVNQGSGGSVMDESNESSTTASEQQSVYYNGELSPQQQYSQQQHNNGMMFNEYQLLDPNVKSRHISLLKQQRRPPPQPPRSLSTSTALSPMPNLNSSPQLQPQYQSPNASNNRSSNSMMQDLQINNRKFTSTTTPPSSSHNSSLRSSSASHTDFDSPFIDIMQSDQEGDISMGDNFLSSPSILINNRLSDDQNSTHPFQRTSQSSLTSQVSLNRYLLDSPNHHDFDFVSKQEQRENNHRILEALRITPTTPSNNSVGSSVNNLYDPLFDSNAFLRGRTSSVSSTFSDGMSTPMTPTGEGGRLSNASNLSLRLSHGMNSDFNFSNNNY
ncbi:predicted protein [Naegleria gruberi]|uniref:Predicted protein n=1 Tax=Naegleria gruberi TaxID=5762 RepID=D2VKG8_NAEGR|nr:uncharacterized protein NAEGRDRAFT_58487 [Naegleria gruberi]EFC42594.1 predicted protein [Naegleria gruberi]|eukprot:XP_002675338.1 predicted protein [Naegleria gruberi strain NEG-M]